MLLQSLREAGVLRPVDGYFAQVRMPLRLAPELAESAFAQPLGRELEAAGLGRVTGHELSLDAGGEPEVLTLSLSLVTDAPRALSLVAACLEELDAPVGSTIGNAECAELIRFGKSEGLGLYLPVHEAGDDERLAVIEACTDALEGAGLYQGSYSFGDRTALYFYGDSFNRMRAAITYVMSYDPRCRNAYARRLN